MDHPFNFFSFVPFQPLTINRKEDVGDALSHCNEVGDHARSQSPRVSPLGIRRQWGVKYGPASPENGPGGEKGKTTKPTRTLLRNLFAILVFCFFCFFVF